MDHGFSEYSHIFAVGKMVVVHCTGQGIFPTAARLNSEFILFFLESPRGSTGCQKEFYRRIAVPHGARILSLLKNC